LQQRRWQLGLLKGLPGVGSIFGLYSHLILPQVLLGTQLWFFLLLLLIGISCNADICIYILQCCHGQGRPVLQVKYKDNRRETSAG
jgi:hypothetical protein